MIGYELVCAIGHKWRRTHGSLIPHSFPHELGTLRREEVREFRSQERARLIRWESHFDGGVETPWWHIIKDSSADLGGLKPKVRNAVRQGVKRFEVRKCSREEIVERGYPVYVAAYGRYETFEQMYDLRQFTSALASMPEGIEFWAVEDRASGELEAFAENVVGREACFYSTMWFSQAALKRNGSYALVHTMNEHYLCERGMRYVSDGARNISHQTNVHQFLQDKFGFRKAYCMLNVEYAAWVAMLVAVCYPFRELLHRWKLSARLDVALEQEHIRRLCASMSR